MKGSLLAEGRTSKVYEFGPGLVVKVLRPEVPRSWAAHEAQVTSAVRDQGLPVPEVHGVVEVDGRPGVVFERVVGPSMWAQMQRAPSRIIELARELADVQQQIHRAGLPTGVPDLVHRISGRLGGVTQLSAQERDEGCALAAELPRGAALLHGDLPPGNVLMGEAGPVVIDWFDAAIGHPVADVVRSSILMRPTASESELPHLPGASAEAIAALHSTYVDTFAPLLESSAESLRRWEAVVAASRLIEGAQPDESALVTLWSDRGRDEPSAVLSR